MNSKWFEIEEDTYQRVDGMCVFPGEYGGWVVAHPDGQRAPKTFPSAAAAMSAVDNKAPGIPVVQPTDTWIN